MFTLGPPRLGLRFGQVALSTQGASAVVSFSGAGTAPLALTLAQAPTSPPALAPQQRSGLGSVLGVLRVAAGLCVWSGGLLRASLQRAGLGCWAGLLGWAAGRERLRLPRGASASCLLPRPHLGPHPEAPRGASSPAPPRRSWQRGSDLAGGRGEREQWARELCSHGLPREGLATTLKTAASSGKPSEARSRARRTPAQPKGPIAGTRPPALLRAAAMKLARAAAAGRESSGDQASAPLARCRCGRQGLPAGDRRQRTAAKGPRDPVDVEIKLEVAPAKASESRRGDLQASRCEVFPEPVQSCLSALARCSLRGRREGFEPICRRG